MSLIPQRHKTDIKFINVLSISCTGTDFPLKTSLGKIASIGVMESSMNNGKSKNSFVTKRRLFTVYESIRLSKTPTKRSPIRDSVQKKNLNIQLNMNNAGMHPLGVSSAQTTVDV